MDLRYAAVVIFGVCGLVLLIGLLRRKAEIVLNFFVRMIVGMVGVCVVNAILARQGIDLAVGMNLITAISLGSLGFGGFFMLYGVLLLGLL